MKLKIKNHRRPFKKVTRVNNRSGIMASLFLTPQEFQSLKNAMKKYSLRRGDISTWL